MTQQQPITNRNRTFGNSLSTWACTFCITAAIVGIVASVTTVVLTILHACCSVGLFRVKGFAWFQQQRTDQYVFHLSGKQRVECGTEGGWQGPPGVQLVLIGQQQDLLQQLHNGLQGCVYSKCPCRCYDTQTAAAQQSDHSNAAAELVHLISQHAWLEVVDTQQEHSQLVQYTAKSSVLHGVLAEEVRWQTACTECCSFIARTPLVIQHGRSHPLSTMPVICLQLHEPNLLSCCFPRVKYTCWVGEASCRSLSVQPSWDDVCANKQKLTLIG